MEDLVVSGELQPGDKLPPEVEIATSLGVSRMTLRQALSAVEAKGFIDRAVAGQVTSAAWGQTTGSAVGLAYLKTVDGTVIDADWLRGGDYQVSVGGQSSPVTVSLRPLYDRQVSGSAASRTCPSGRVPALSI